MFNRELLVLLLFLLIFVVAVAVFGQLRGRREKVEEGWWASI